MSDHFDGYDHDLHAPAGDPAGLGHGERRRKPRLRRWDRAYDGTPPGRGRSERWRRRTQSDWRDRWEQLRERDRDRGWSERGREALRRYRQPIIGLTMIGAAAPLAKGVRSARDEGIREEQAQTASGAVGDAPLEDRIGEQWAENQADASREGLVQQAMGTYKIPRPLAEDIHDYAVRNDIDPELGFGLVKTESAFKNRAVSSVGARGLTQVMPRTARWLQPGTTVEDLYRQDLNLDMGFGYLRDMIDKYKGNVRLALLAYNRGPGTVDKVLKRGGDPNNGYADKVLEGYDDLGR